MSKNVKNGPFYKAKFRNRPIETIDGYDKRSMMDRFRKYRDRRMKNGWSGCSSFLRFKTRAIVFVGSSSDAPDASSEIKSWPL